MCVGSLCRVRAAVVYQQHRGDEQATAPADEGRRARVEPQREHAALDD